MRHADVSGVAAVGDAFVLTAGTGEVVVIDAGDGRVRRRRRVAGTRWDNHLAALG